MSPRKFQLNKIAISLLLSDNFFLYLFFNKLNSVKHCWFEIAGNRYYQFLLGIDINRQSNPIFDISSADKQKPYPAAPTPLSSENHIFPLGAFPTVKALCAYF